MTTTQLPIYPKANRNTVNTLQAISHPAAWQGDQLAQRDDWQLLLSDADRAELATAMAELSGQSIETEQIEAADFPLPQLGSKLAAVQTSLEQGSGATVICGLPVGEYSHDDLQRLFWGVTRHIGTPVSQSAKGERIFSVRDAGFADDDPRNRGPMTRKGLTFHSDRCDCIAFLCLKQAKEGGENEVVSSVSIYNAMLAERPDLLEVLLQPYLYQRHNVDLGNQRSSYLQPIFSFHEGHFAGFLMEVLIKRAYAQDDTPDMTALQREALDYVQEKAGQLAFRFRQEPGDLVLLNNLVTLHRRSEFVDHEALAERRHILRIWLAVPNSRPLDPAFEPTFGDTRAGAIRGGMRSR